MQCNKRSAMERKVPSSRRNSFNATLLLLLLRVEVHILLRFSLVPSTIYLQSLDRHQMHVLCWFSRQMAQFQRHAGAACKNQFRFQFQKPKPILTAPIPSLSLPLSLHSYSNCCGPSVCVVFALRCFVGWPNMCPACVCALHGSCLPVAPGVCVGVSPRVVQAVGSGCQLGCAAQKVQGFPFGQLIRFFSASLQAIGTTLYGNNITLDTVEQP